MENEQTTQMPTAANSRVNNRVPRQKQIVSERKEAHYSKEANGVRARSYYDEPDYEIIAEYNDRVSHLLAPPFPGYQQRWISKDKDKGAHLHYMLNQGGWAIRNPATVPHTAKLNTQKWGEIDCLMAGNELVLCYMRQDIYDERQRRKAEYNQQLTRDRTGSATNLMGETRTMRSERGEAYGRATGATSKSEVVFNKQPI